MEDKTEMIKTLLERAGDYGKISYELAKLKTIDKTSDVISSLVPHSVVLVIMITFMLFLSLGLAFWLGQIMGEIYFGFLVIAGFYCITGILIHFLLHKWLKKLVGNAFIKHVLK